MNVCSPYPRGGGGGGLEEMLCRRGWCGGGAEGGGVLSGLRPCSVTSLTSFMLSSILLKLATSLLCSPPASYWFVLFF